MNVDIAICTYRRPQVAETLRSIAAQILAPDCAIRVIVADNDETDSARTTVAAAAKETGLNVTYIHAPAKNISIARNACLDTATAPFLVFIDDDEIATARWLSELLATQERTGADVVLGPVNAVYGPDAPEWMKKQDFHSVMPVWVNGVIITGYAGNALVKREGNVNAIRFREEFGGGGEDTAYFAEIVKAGGRIAFASTAIATEEVPPERAQFSWLLARRFKYGQIHGRLLLEKNKSLGFRLVHITKAKVKAIFCALSAISCVGNPNKKRYWLLRGALHAGVVSALLGRAA